MHIPDGFLSTATIATTFAVSAGGVACAVGVANKKLEDKRIPLLGVTAAFIFAAQMLNFPVAGGTSGHLLGSTLAAILLGPWMAVLIMACVLMVQCLLFQDGGLLALGANVLNMGVIASFVGYYLYQGISSLMGRDRRGMMVGAFVGAWSGVFLAASACAAELWVSGTSPFSVVFPAMAGWHALIGIGEGLITVTVLSLVLAARRDLLQPQKV
ncbi:MAG: cobalamin biosynthesis protein CbiM [Chloroflexi bacterium]|nr:cobalamin biosynthesis protein CbiM [Chloroflexota bacterium]